MTIRAITLDLDDTLWPVLPTLIHAEQVLKQWLQSHAPTTAANLDETNRTRLRNAIVAQYPDRAHDMSWLREQLLRQGLQENGDDPDLAKPAFDAFLAARQQVQCYDEVHAVLSDWAERYTLIAISNGNADVVSVGLGDYISAAVSAHEQAFAKPDPRMFRMACEMAGTTLEQTLHIGDDWQMDIAPARALGMPVAWIRRPDLKHKLVDDADPAVPVFTDLRQIDSLLNQTG